MNEPPRSGPDFAGPGFAGCYRHPDRQTGITCRRCHQPICGECMRPAAVGFQCPKCVATGRSSVRTARTSFGAALSTTGGTGTKIVMGVIVGLYVLNLITRGIVLSLTVTANTAVAAGEFWRLVTYGFVSVGLLGVLLNLLVLWLVGRALESEMGTWRFLALYVVAGIGGATLCFVVGPPELVAGGASAAVLGLLAANTIGKLKTGEDVRGDLGLIVLLILYSLLIGFNGFGWVGMIGAALVGALAGVVLAYAPRQNRTPIQIAGLLAVALVCLVAVVGRIVAF